MKKSVFTLGLIAGIAGIVSCGILLYVYFGMPADKEGIGGVLGIGIVALLLQIAGLVFSISAEKKTKLAGIVMILAAISDLVASLASMSIDSIISFLLCFITFILFLIAGIISITTKPKTVMHE